MEEFYNTLAAAYWQIYIKMNFILRITHNNWKIEQIKYKILKK